MTTRGSVATLVAVTDPEREGRLVALFERAGSGVQVARRCLDVADLLAAAEAGAARAAVVSADLRGLDRDCVSRLGACGVGVVGLAPDDSGRARLLELGMDAALPLDVDAAELAGALAVAAARAAEAGRAQRARRAFGGAVPSQTAASEPAAREPADEAAPQPSELAGRIIAVWGPTGAPGRTTVAVGMAGELAARRVRTLLVDADVYGGVVAPVLGVLDESPGLAAATRLATNGTLDAAVLAALCRSLGDDLSVLTGVSRADRWPELRPAAVEAVLALARRLARAVIVDCGFCLEQDEELSYDTVAPRRNGATLAVLAAADEVVAVGSADPVGLQRLVRGLAELRELSAQPVTVVVNRVRKSVVGREPEAEVAAALRRYAGVERVEFLPYDRAGCDAALAGGRLLTEASPGSPLRAPLRRLATRLAGQPEPAASRWTRRKAVVRTGVA